MPKVLQLSSGQFAELQLYNGVELEAVVAASDTIYGFVKVAVTLTLWKFCTADASSISAVFDVWRTNDGSVPTDSDSITDGNEISISSKSYDSGSISGWSSVALAVGDRIAIHVDSISAESPVYLSIFG